MHRKSQGSTVPRHPHVLRHLPNDAVEAVLEPLDGLGLVDLVADTDGGLAAATLGNTLTGAGPIEKKNCQFLFPVVDFRGLFIEEAPLSGALTCSSRSPCRRYQYRGRT